VGDWIDRVRADRWRGKAGLTTAEREELAKLRKEVTAARGLPATRPPVPPGAPGSRSRSARARGAPWRRAYRQSRCTPPGAAPPSRTERRRSWGSISTRCVCNPGVTRGGLSPANRGEVLESAEPALPGVGSPALSTEHSLPDPKRGLNFLLAGTWATSKSSSPSSRSSRRSPTSSTRPTAATGRRWPSASRPSCGST